MWGGQVIITQYIVGGSVMFRDNQSLYSLVWCDNRTQSLADKLVSQTPTKNKDYYRVIHTITLISIQYTT